MSGRSNKRDLSKTPDHRANSIEIELEQLLGLGDSSEDGDDLETEALTDKLRKTRKIQYKHRTDDSKETNEETQSKKSARSKRNKRDRNITRSTSRSSKESTDESLENDIGRNSSGGSKSHKPNSRNIKYRSKEPETAEERDRDARSHRSKDSKGSRVSRRSGYRKSNRSKSSGRITDDDNRVVDKGNTDGETNTRTTASSQSKRISYRKREISSQSAKDKDVKSTISEQSAISGRRTSLRRSWSYDDFENNDWSSSEEEIEVGLNDAGGIDLNNADDRDNKEHSAARSGGDCPRRYTMRGNKSMKGRNPPIGDMKRSSSAGGLDGENRSFNSVLSPQVPYSRRPSRKTLGASAIDVDMVLGNPSRKAPPSRSKSNDLFLSSRLQIDRKAPPTRSTSNDFATFLRKQGQAQKPDRTMTHKSHSDHNETEIKGEDDKDNPFEVTYKSCNVSDNWEAFASEYTPEKEFEDTKERRGNLSPTRSGGFLLTSSKDTISRLRVGANVTAGNNNNITSNIEDEPGDTKTEREKGLGFLQNKTSSKDTISRLRVGANVPAGSNNNITSNNEYEAGDAKTEREKGLGFFQNKTSSKDTISRLRVGANVTAGSNNNITSSNEYKSGDAKTEREKGLGFFQNKTSSKDTISRLRVGANVTTSSNNNITNNNEYEAGDVKTEREKGLGFLQNKTSSKDTISRLRIGSNVTASSNNEYEHGDAKTQREKQRKADYKKAIAAAAMAGRRLSNRAPRPQQRQTRTVRSSFEESVKQLEGALQKAR